MVPVVLCACLGWKSEGYIFTAGFSDDDLLLVNSVGSINKLGNIEALVLNKVLTLDFGDLNSLGDTDLLRSRVSKGAGELERDSNKRNLVCLSLIFLAAHLMFSMTISRRAISRSSTSGHLHSLRFLLISDLGSGARSSDILPLIDISTDLSVYGCGGLLAHSEDTIKAIVVVYDLLDCKSDWGHLLSKGGHADLGIDGGVGIPAVVLRGIAITRIGSRGKRDDRGEENDQHVVTRWTL